MQIKKRFIAGARCEKCHCIDTLRWWQVNDVENTECVNCGFAQKQPQEAAAAAEKTENSANLIGIFKPD